MPRLTPRATSLIAPGVTRTELTAFLSRFVSLAQPEPDLEPEHKASVPENVVWQFWWQGEDELPEIVRAAFASVRRFVAPRPVVIVHQGNYADYVDLPDMVKAQFKAGQVSLVELSDYIRLALLARYGGTWIDPTVYLTAAPPPGSIDAELFVFSSPLWMCLPPERLSPALLSGLRFFCDRPSATLFGSAWWISARRNARTIRTFKRLWLECLLQKDRPRDYMMAYNLYSLALLVSDACRREWNRMPKVCVSPTQLLVGHLYEPYDETVWQAVLSLTSVHKLTHKIVPEYLAPHSFYDKVLASLN